MKPVVSIVVPVFNEATALPDTLSRLQAAYSDSSSTEIIIVDDGSTDATPTLLKEQNRFTVIHHEINQGKGAAIRTGIAHSHGDIIALYDADAEYALADLSKLIDMVGQDHVPVAYGSRMTGNNPIGYRRYYLGNLIISAWARLLYGVSLTDVETGAKVFHRDAYEKISLQQNRFGFEIELTARLLRCGYTISELPITYTPRTFAEGKKITWLDGVQALWLLFYYRFW